MARTKHICPAREVFHVLNRAVVRLPIYAMVAMPDHWHFVVRPETRDQVREFFRNRTSPLRQK